MRLLETRCVQAKDAIAFVAFEDVVEGVHGNPRSFRSKVRVRWHSEDTYLLAFQRPEFELQRAPLRLTYRVVPEILPLESRLAGVFSHRANREIALANRCLRVRSECLCGPLAIIVRVSSIFHIHKEFSRQCVLVFSPAEAMSLA